MSDAVREQLLGYLLGALDDDEQENIDQRLEGEPELREQLGRMRAALPLPDRALFEWESPPGLAARTCRMVAARRDAAPAGAGPHAPMPMSSEASPPAGRRAVRWIDAATAAAVAVAAFLVVGPAVQDSRERARRDQCTENLREFHVAMTGYSERSGGFFPGIVADGEVLPPGAYLLVLAGDGYLADPSRAMCPGSPEAGRADLRGLDWNELRTLPFGAIDRLRQALSGIYGYHPGYLENGLYRPTRNQRRPYMGILADSPSPGLPDFRSLNHSGGQHVLFEAGNVRFLLSPGPPAWPDFIYLNNQGQAALPSVPNDTVILPPTHPLGIEIGGIR
jgi:hypothetical protein